MENQPQKSDRIEICNLRLTPVTPIHIGGGDDKHLKMNLDYVKDHDKVRIIDWEKTITEIRSATERSFVMNDLKNGKIQGDPRYHLQYSTDYYWKGNVGRDLKMFIKNGMGKAFLPGTSLKGALRSTMVEAYNPDKNRIRKGNELEKETIGTFSESLFSLITVRDTDFSNSLFLCNSKIYNLNRNNESAWKNAFRNANEPHINEREMATMAECLIPGQSKAGQIVFQRPAFAERKNKMNDRNRKIIEQDWKEDPWQWMATTARSYMEKYLQSEVDYFKRFDQANYGAQLIEAFQKLQDFHERLNKNQFLIRMGWGSGFHQMTGNWKFPDHINQALNGQYKKDQYKSRKIAFWHSENEIHFVPMGFMLMELQSAAGSELQMPFELNKEKRIKHTPTKEENKPVEKPEPTYAEPQTIRNNSEVFAEVLGTEGIQVKVKVFLKGYENKVFQFRYAAGIETGKIIVARLQFHRRKLKDGFNLVFLRMYDL